MSGEFGVARRPGGEYAVAVPCHETAGRDGPQVASSRGF